jgi:hypothetical protein
LNRKKSSYPAEKGEAMHAKNTMREKSFNTKQLQKHSYENRAQTTEKMEMQPKEKKPTHHTANELGSGGVKEFAPPRKNERK